MGRELKAIAMARTSQLLKWSLSILLQLKQGYFLIQLYCRRKWSMMIQLSTGSFKYKFSASRVGLLLESCHYMSLSLRSLLDWGVRFTPLVSLSHIGFCQGENYSPQPPKVEIQSNLCCWWWMLKIRLDLPWSIKTYICTVYIYMFIDTPFLLCWVTQMQEYTQSFFVINLIWPNALRTNYNVALPPMTITVTTSHTTPEPQPKSLQQQCQKTFENICIADHSLQDWDKDI